MVRHNISIYVALSLVVGSCSPPINSPLGQSADLSPSWSPVGDSIAFVHFAFSPGDSVRTGIYIVGKAGGPRRLIREEFVRSVGWSPDGTSLVFDTAQGLFTCTTNGDSLRQVFAGEAYLPSWSPSGDLIAFDDISHVWTVSATGGPATCVTATVGGGRDPDWSPSGDALLILTSFPGARGEELATITTSGQLIRRLTNDQNEDRAPSWSPSGTTIAWNKWPQGAQGVVHPEFWASDTSGSAGRFLLGGEGAVDWSTNGSEVVLSKSTPAGSRLFVMSSAATGLRQITF